MVHDLCLSFAEAGAAPEVRLLILVFGSILIILVTFVAGMLTQMSPPERRDFIRSFFPAK